MPELDPNDIVITHAMDLPSDDMAPYSVHYHSKENVYDGKLYFIF